MQIIDRWQARIRGLKFYFSGNPCKQGHIARRRVKDRCCEECSKTRCRAFYHKNKQRRKQEYSQWREKNKAKRKLYMDAWRLENKEHVQNYSETYKLQNAEAMKQVAKQYRVKHKDKVNTLNRNRYAFRKSVEGNHTHDDIIKLRRDQRDKCNFCRVHFRETGFHVDHVIPISRGGTNWPTNLQLLCPDCNVRKSDKIISKQYFLAMRRRQDIIRAGNP